MGQPQLHMNCAFFVKLYVIKQVHGEKWEEELLVLNNQCPTINFVLFFNLKEKYFFTVRVALSTKFGFVTVGSLVKTVKNRCGLQTKYCHNIFKLCPRPIQKIL